MFASTQTEVNLESGHTMIVEKDVAIRMRDGATLYADVFRPKEGGKVPSIINLSCYQKDKVWVPPPDLDEKPDPYMNWETVSPSWWVPRGYACVRIDTRGSGKSPGMSDPGSYQEALDFYDAIEWAARQPWCSGKVGASGISYHATSQWKVAGLKPPSLQAIIPWEGWADGYRDAAYHGGIFSLYFTATWYATQIAHHLLGKPQSYNPDAFRNERLWMYMRQNLDTGWWDDRSAHWDQIDVPLYSAGNWSGMALHLRGNVEGYMRAASKHKKLRIHTGTHYHPFYSEEGKNDQLRFLDCWLKGKDTGIMQEPPVKLLIRTGGGGMKDYRFRYENEWPIARTQWTKFYLKADRGEPAAEAGATEGNLTAERPKQSKSVTYAATGMARGGSGAIASSTTLAAGSLHRTGVSFVTGPLTEDTEVTGPVNLVLWVSSTSEDMDIFATIRNIGPDGNDVWEIGQQGQQVPVAKGWLRASHRELDPELSLPYRPYHKHKERLLLKSGEPVECQVEIWPTCMVFKKGHRIRLDIQPRDGAGASPYTHYHADYNTGQNTLYTGGDKASYLLLPVIPPK
ncbi:MAG TPA: CocE/NonD family hydrolase [Burkholderiales bacterium]|nr:CocE/NonD family hydrolase [Burkholderiales bacterium]